MIRGVVLALLLFLSYGSGAQTIDEYQELPLLLRRGEQLTVSYDSAYLITAPRYALYQQLHRYLLDTSAWLPYDELIQTYERALHRSDQAYRHLLRQYQTADSLSQSTLRTTQSVLRQADRSLSGTQNTLEKATHGLDETERLIRQERRRAARRHVLFGAGGVGVGLLISVLVR